MSRTHRTQPKRMYRKPRTFNLIRENESLITDVRAEEFEHPISKLNRANRFIPDAWEDIPIASNYEYKRENNFN